MPGAFSAAALTAMREHVTFVTEARVVTNTGTLVTPLAVLGGSLTMDEEWAPYVQASLTCADPGVGIDPRLAHRVIIDAGYVYPSGTREVHQLATLVVTDATRDQRTNQLTLSARSDEALVQDGAHWGVSDITPTYASHQVALVDFLTRALTSLGAPTVSGSVVGTSAAMTAYLVRTGSGWWSHIESVRDMAGGIVYCDEARTWRIGYPVPDDSPDTLQGMFTTGDVPRSWPYDIEDDPYTLPIITDAQVRYSRQEWANAVGLVHTWTDSAGTNQRVARIAAVASGPFAPTTVGYRVQTLFRSTPIDATAATAACNSILYRTQRRGERREITARACWWLRPRTLTRFWIGGVDTFDRITRVTWELDGSGLMTILTRAPEPEAI